MKKIFEKVCEVTGLILVLVNAVFACVVGVIIFPVILLVSLFVPKYKGDALLANYWIFFMFAINMFSTEELSKSLNRRDGSNRFLNEEMYKELLRDQTLFDVEEES